MDESTQPPPASTSHSEGRNLLLLQDYVRKVCQAQLMLETNICFIAETEILTGIFSEHDRRTLRTACQCLNSLRIRVEARANTVERAMIEQQLQFMQSRVQPVLTEDLRTADTSCPSGTCRPWYVARSSLLTILNLNTLVPFDYNLLTTHWTNTLVPIKDDDFGKALLSGFGVCPVP